MFKKCCNYCNKKYVVKRIEDLQEYFYKKDKCKDGVRPMCISCFKKFYNTKEQNKKNIIRQREKRGNIALEDLKNKVCVVCNNEFKPKRVHSKTCSIECRATLERARKRLYYRRKIGKIGL